MNKIKIAWTCILIGFFAIIGFHENAAAFCDTITSCPVPKIDTVWAGTAGDRSILGEDVNFAPYESVFAQISNAGTGIMAHANEYGAILDADDVLIISQQLDSTWGDHLNFDPSFNTVFDCEPGLADDNVFEVVSATDESGSLRSSSNPREYYFSYDGLNDWNMGAVTIEQWVNYLEKIALTHGKIDRLTIFCHGDMNLLKMSDDFVLHYENPDIGLYDIDSQNDVKNDAHTRTQLERLQTILSNNASILLFSCKIAQNAAGRDLVREIASLTGATVYANSNSTWDYSASGETDWSLDFVVSGEDGPQVASIFSDEDVIDYLKREATGWDAQNLSIAMIKQLKDDFPDLWTELQAMILIDDRLHFLDDFEPEEPPDYNVAMEFVWLLEDFAMDVLATFQVINPIYAGIYQAASTFSYIAEYSSWLQKNRDKVAVKNQIHFYIYFREVQGSLDPFAEFGVAEEGYLIQPNAIRNLFTIVTPLHKEIYTVEKIKTLAETWYEHKVLKKEAYRQQKNKVLEATGEALASTLTAYNSYASGYYAHILELSDTSVVIGNSGSFPMRNIVLINDRLGCDQKTIPVTIEAGQNIVLFHELSDIDYVTFEVLNTRVQVDYESLIAPIIPLLSYQFAEAPGYAPQNVNFRITPLPVGEAFTYTIDFGDNTSASGAGAGAVNEAHVYTAPGIYTASLTMTAFGGYSGIAKRTIEIKNPITMPYPIGNTEYGFGPLSVNFDASGASSATGGVLSYHWDFDDGNESTSVNPTHVFDAGTYHVKLTVELTPEVFVTAVQTIKVIDPSGKLAVTPELRSVSSTSGETTFMVANTGDGTMNWTVSIDPSDTWVSLVSSSTGVNDSVVRLSFQANTEPVLRTASITVTAADALNSPQTVLVSQAPAGYVVEFSASKLSGVAPLEVQFSDLSTSQNTSISSWEWDFGDGGTSTEQNPTHTYTSYGTYDVSLTISDGVESVTGSKPGHISVYQSPTVTPDIDIVEVEYFFDNDPGVGNGRFIPISRNNVVTVQTNINLSGLSLGLHRLYVRARDENNNWGVVQCKPVLVVEEAPGTPAPDLTQVEYFFDTDPGAGSGTSLNVTQDIETQVSKNIDLSGVPLGLHRLYFRAKDEKNHWGIVQTKPVLVQKYAKDTPPPDITGVEYFFDDDPGIGSGTGLTITPEKNVTLSNNINLSGLSTGLHRFYIRALDGYGNWGIVQTKPVLVQEKPHDAPLPDIIALEYFFDADPGFGLGSSLGCAPGSNVTVNGNLPLDQLSTGNHRLYVRAMDDTGTWGIAQDKNISVSTDADLDGLMDDFENTRCTDANDADTDDDGIIDGVEDANHNGIVDAGETDPCNIDSDGDGIQDGTELGVTLVDIGADTNIGIFQPDLDPTSTTNPLDADTDGDGFDDGEEDLNKNGRVDPGESDPNDEYSAPIPDGDINGDGVLDLKDTILALKITAGIDPGQTIYKAADVNEDHKIGIEEAVYGLQVLAGVR